MVGAKHAFVTGERRHHAQDLLSAFRGHGFLPHRAKSLYSFCTTIQDSVVITLQPMHLSLWAGIVAAPDSRICEAVRSPDLVCFGRSRRAGSAAGSNGRVEDRTPGFG